MGNRKNAVTLATAWVLAVSMLLTGCSGKGISDYIYKEDGYLPTRG